MEEKETLQYSIWDPTGNITALVESPVDESEQRAVAASIMARHAAVEQVGFVRLPDEKSAPAALRMAGGEFCANASMSAASLWALRLGLCEGELSLAVSGAEDAVAVRLKQEDESCFSAAVRMPEAREIIIRVSGNGFLYNMVRIIAGTLIDVGHGRLPEDCIARALESKNRLA